VPGIRFSKSCSGCGRVITAGAWCTTCADTDPDAPQRPKVESDTRRENPGGNWSTWRDRSVQGAFRGALEAVYGPACMAGMPSFAEWFPGLSGRCSSTDGLQAHHGKDGFPDMLLCRVHHREVDPWAR
jgi:hypothetical protein